jgi:hypothetical protein
MNLQKVRCWLGAHSAGPTSRPAWSRLAADHFYRHQLQPGNVECRIDADVAIDVID